MPVPNFQHPQHGESGKTKRGWWWWWFVRCMLLLEEVDVLLEGLRVLCHTIMTPNMGHNHVENTLFSQLRLG
eukprot:3987921-Amphidinium_carterae.1